jgi:hypothetical protein
MFGAGSDTNSHTLIGFKDNNNNLHGISLITPSASDYYAWYPQILIQGTNYGTWTYNTDRDVMLPQHEWSLIGATYDGATYRLYRNGILVKSASQSTTATAYNNGIDTISPGDVAALFDARVEPIQRDEGYYVEAYQRMRGLMTRVPYRNTEVWTNMVTENPTSTIWG